MSSGSSYLVDANSERMKNSKIQNYLFKYDARLRGTSRKSKPPKQTGANVGDWVSAYWLKTRFEAFVPSVHLNYLSLSTSVVNKSMYIFFINWCARPRSESPDNQYRYRFLYRCYVTAFARLTFEHNRSRFLVGSQFRLFRPSCNTRAMAIFIIYSFTSTLAAYFFT